MKLFAKPVGFAIAAGMFASLAAPQSADACWWLYKKSAAAEPAVEAPAPGPGPVAEIAPRVVVIVPTTPSRAEECAIANKGLVGDVVKSNRRWVEAVYEVRSKQAYATPVLETRTRTVEVAAVYQTAYRQEWIAAEYTSVCRREYHPATFRSVCREVTDEPQYREISVQKYVPPVVKCEKQVRCTPDGKGGFTSVEDVKLVIVSQGRFEMQTERKLIAEGGSRMIFETAQDKPGYFVERIENVMVKPGMYRTVQDRVLVQEARKELVTETFEVKPGRLETVEEKVMVRPAQWEEAATVAGR
jgi:hypothetical protein